MCNKVSHTARDCLLLSHEFKAHEIKPTERQVASVEDKYNFCQCLTSEAFVFVAHNANTPGTAQHAKVDTSDVPAQSMPACTVKLLFAVVG